MENKYIDNTLIKLRRLYSKDETLNALFKKVEELSIENGILHSEKDELEYKLKNLDILYKQKYNDKFYVAKRTEDAYNKLLETIKKHARKEKDLLISNNDILYKLNDCRRKVKQCHGDATSFEN